MSVEAKQLDTGVGVVTISGRLALGGETERLDAAIKGMLQKNVKTFVLDISGLEYVDSSGIGMLVSCLTKLKKAGVLKPTRGSHMPLYFTEYGYFASGKRSACWSQ